MTDSTVNNLGVQGTSINAARFGIYAGNYLSGNTTVTMSAGNSIVSGSTGIFAQNYATAIFGSAHSSITVTANGTITSGQNSAVNGGSAGILAGYNGAINGPFVPDLAVTGTVLVNNNANITAAAGLGIDAYNYGNGNVTVNDTAQTVSGAQTGIGAYQYSGGTGDVAVTVAAGANVTGATGISVVVTGSGTVDIANYGTVKGTSTQGVYVYMSGAGTATLDNYGTINGGLTLAGAAFTLALNQSGTVSLAAQFLLALNPGETIVNNGNAIEGYGQIGDGGDNNLTLNNAAGIVDANVSNQTLVVNTKNIVTNGGVLEANGGTLLVFDAVAGSGSAIIEGSGTLELGGADAQAVTFYSAGGTLKLDNPTPTTFTGHINGLIVGDTIDLINTTVTSAVISGSTLTVTESNKSTLTYTVAGSFTGNAFIVNGDGNGGTNLTLEPVGYLTASPSTYYWSDTYIPSQPTTGVHLFPASIETDTFTGTVAVQYSSTGPTPSYNQGSDPAGPYAITHTAVPLDPFFLPTLAGSQVVLPPTSLTLPARSQLLLPTVNATSGLDTEGISIYVTQDGNGNDIINQTVITGSGNGDYSPLSIGSPTQIENAGTNTVYNLQAHVRQDNGTAPASYLSSYSVAWDQYNASTGTYSLRFQIFNPDGSASSSVITPTITSAGGTSVTVSATPSAIGVTTLPAWEFRNASGAYVLAVAENNSTNDFIQFQGYTTSGATNGTNFKITPDLSHYAAGRRI